MRRQPLGALHLSMNCWGVIPKGVSRDSEVAKPTDDTARRAFSL
jgi:hypothetical protein